MKDVTLCMETPGREPGPAHQVDASLCTSEVCLVKFFFLRDKVLLEYHLLIFFTVKVLLFFKVDSLRR